MNLWFKLTVDSNLSFIYINYNYAVTEYNCFEGNFKILFD